MAWNSNKQYLICWQAVKEKNLKFKILFFVSNTATGVEVYFLGFPVMMM